MGGMNLAVRNVTGKGPRRLFRRLPQPLTSRCGSSKEAIGVESATIFNPEYVKGGDEGAAHRSASQITEVVTNTYGWNITKARCHRQGDVGPDLRSVVEDSYGPGTEQFFRQRNPAACRNHGRNAGNCPQGNMEPSGSSSNTLASLHGAGRRVFGSTGSGFSGNNAKLQGVHRRTGKLRSMRRPTNNESRP